MKKPVRSFVISLISFYIIVQFIPGIHFGNRLDNLLVAASVFAVLSIFVAPVIKALLLPFNMITFGGISALINLALIYFLVFLLPFFKIADFMFPGISVLGFAIPAFQASPLITVLMTSVAVGFGSSVLTYLFR